MPALPPDVDRALALGLGTWGMLWPQWLFKEGTMTVTFSS